MTRVNAGCRPDRHRRAWLGRAACFIAFGTVARSAWSEQDTNSRFTISRQADEFIIEGVLEVSVPPAVAWAVLVDYEHMHRFVPDMSESRVLAREGDRLRVLQRGFLPFGPFRFAYDVERDVWLTPESAVVSRGVRGNMRKVELLTEIEAREAGVTIRHRAAIVPDFWVPPLLGPRMLRARAEAQFAALVAEMKRRTAEGSR